MFGSFVDQVCGIILGGGLARVFVLLCLAVGVFEGFKLLAVVLSFLYRYILRPELCLKHFGEWAVITGATDGIGRAYCEQLAARGSCHPPDVVLIAPLGNSEGLKIFMLSRSEVKLESMGKELTDNYGVETRHMTVDFSKVSSATWKAIRTEIDELDVAILINNVGCSYDHYEYLHVITDETVDNLVEINVRATTQMSRCVLPGMVSRKRGIVVCIGSGVGSLLQNCPLLTAYAGTKAYVEQFVRSCSLEYRKFNIIFQDQAPLFVATKMSKIRKERLSVPSPERWVASAIGGIGYDVITPGYWYHSLMWLVLQRLPTAILDNYVVRLAESVRIRALQKKNAQMKGT